MWKEKIANFAKTNNTTFTLGDQADSEAIFASENKLGITFPTDLKELLAECDGVYNDTMAHILYSLEDLVRWNQTYWSDKELIELFIDFSKYFVIGDFGNGDLFMYELENNKVNSKEIYGWNHEENVCKVVADSLEDYLRRYFERNFSF